MQAQAMQAAAANAAWTQGNNPYLSGLCFPYNLYGAAAPQQLYAAYARSAHCCRLSMDLFVHMLKWSILCCLRPLACSDCASLPSSPRLLQVVICLHVTTEREPDRDNAPCSLAPQASPWGTMDGGAGGNLPAPSLGSGQACSNDNSVPLPTSQPSPSSWGIGNGNNLGLGDNNGLQAQQQWIPNLSRGNGGVREASAASSMWPAWPTHSNELAMTADNKVRPSHHTNSPPAQSVS